mmetsp:Transcript_5190/g.11417  ORF Transcript_5190/g.11417 Transcript_5190/m.11417 type:complete len:201 (+) Transcript_5190:264-866(+)
MSRNTLLIKPRILRMPLLLPMAIICWIKPFFLRPKHRPRWCIRNIILNSKFKRRIGSVPRRKLLKLIVIDPRPPLPLRRVIRIRNRELIDPREQDAARMLVLACQIIFRKRVFSSLLANGVQFLFQNLGEFHDFVMPRGIAHIEIGCIRLSTKGDTFHFHERTVSEGDETSISPDFIAIPSLDNGQPRHRPLSLVFQTRK